MVEAQEVARSVGDGIAKGADRDWRTQFDPTDPTFGDQFNLISDDLVANCPIAGTVDDEYVVSRHADVLTVLQDAETFSSKTGIRGVTYQPPEDQLLRPNEMDAPEHTWFRKSWAPYFTETAIQQYEPELRNITNRLIDAFVDDGRVELVSQFSDPLACSSFCEAVANMPSEDMPFLQKAMMAALAGASDEVRMENWGKAHQYMVDFLQERAGQPRRDDIVDTILQFEYPDGRPYTMGERASSLVQVTAAGLTTTGAILSGAIHHLATHAPDRRRLLAEPGALPIAVEEFLRYFVAAPLIGRRVVKETEVGGVAMTADDYVWYNLGGANRDPAVFDDPTELRIDRSPNKHLTFASGPHRCIGRHFARLNIRVALQTFLDRIPDFDVPAGFEPHFQGGMTRRMTLLELTFPSR